LSEEIVFGPVPSRRLGLSLGVNNVFPKYCSYSCVYCQVGRTDHLEIERRSFYDPEKLVKEVVKAYRERRPDVVTFVPNGELLYPLGLEAQVYV
jgi:wyosine [tRNA(Phe)-imidazoG37] synthetase (radical SAM superfamily)